MGSLASTVMGHSIPYNTTSGLTRPKKVPAQYGMAVWQVDVVQEMIVLSERAALTADLVHTGLKPGAVVDGVVRNLKDFGAFVALRSPDGHMHGAEVCALHIYSPFPGCS